MKKYSVANFVFSSSATVYGIPTSVPLVETMPTGCTNPYGWTKLMNEQILTDAAKDVYKRQGLHKNAHYRQNKR